MTNADHSTNHHDSDDELLALAVREAISYSEPIRATALDELEIGAQDGRVLLEGQVASAAHKWVAERLARAVPGVTEVVNRLITSEDLECQISHALAEDEATRHLRIAVRVGGKSAALFGAVETPEVRDRAGEVAAAAVQGLEIHNKLQLLPAGQPVLLLWQQSVEGRQEAAAIKAQQEAEAERAAAQEPAAPSVPPAIPAEGMA